MTSAPLLHPEAKRYDRLTYDECLARNLRVMDATAISLCRENNMPILVFDLNTPGSIVQAALGADIGTQICPS